MALLLKSCAGCCLDHHSYYPIYGEQNTCMINILSSNCPTPSTTNFLFHEPIVSIKELNNCLRSIKLASKLARFTNIDTN